MTADDPYDADQQDALRSTDELLDRIGARTPTPEDLSDPVVAALALVAAEIDLDAVPVESSRGALEQAFPDLLLGVCRAPASVDRSGRVLDVRNERDAEVVDALASRLPSLSTGRGWSRNDDLPRGARRSARRPEHAAVAMAPPRSLPRVAPPPGRARAGSRPEGRPARRLRPLTAVVVAVAAIILGSGVTAAVTGGRSINPMTVVAQLTDGRTADQQQLYEADLRRINAARSYVQQGKRSEAVHQLNRVSVDGLSEDDTRLILARVKQVLGLLGSR